ncbi:MAG: hypothetical protein NDJ90_14000 [Oligoflexia bacterium]|nr:hypothetical protein [Oligoflexia bacterium]
MGLLRSLERDPKTAVTVLIGEDAFRSPLPDTVSYKVIRRPGLTSQAPEALRQGNIERVTLDGIDGLSSSLARSKVQAGEPLHEILPDSVRRFIERNRLYVAPSSAETPQGGSSHAWRFSFRRCLP